eukprot:6458200-Amphidinium_carterae.1
MNDIILGLVAYDPDSSGSFVLTLCSVRAAPSIAVAQRAPSETSDLIALLISELPTSRATHEKK